MCHFQNAKKGVQRDSSNSTFLNVPFFKILTLMLPCKEVTSSTVTQTR
jgi:hypothetical protein